MGGITAFGATGTAAAGGVVPFGYEFRGGTFAGGVVCDGGGMLEGGGGCGGACVTGAEVAADDDVFPTAYTCE